MRKHWVRTFAIALAAAILLWVAYDNTIRVDISLKDLSPDGVSHAYAYYGAYNPYELDEDEVQTLISLLRDIRLDWRDRFFTHEQYSGGSSYHSPTFQIEWTDATVWDLDWITAGIPILIINGEHYRGRYEPFHALDIFYGGLIDRIRAAAR